MAVPVLLYGCASNPAEQYAYKVYPGPERPPSELATLDISGVHTVTVDGLQVTSWDYGTVLLLPGKHALTIGKGYAFSVLVEPEMHGTFEDTQDVELEAGRVYRILSERSYGQGYQVYFWVEAADTGDVIAGVKKP